jgi:hypothetical protein
MHTGEEAKPPFAVPSDRSAVFLVRFRFRAFAPAHDTFCKRAACRRARRDRLPIGLVTTAVGT